MGQSYAFLQDQASLRNSANEAGAGQQAAAQSQVRVVQRQGCLTMLLPISGASAGQSGDMYTGTDVVRRHAVIHCYVELLGPAVQFGLRQCLI